MKAPKVTPLLMTRENVIAIREGRKTQTRRVLSESLQHHACLTGDCPHGSCLECHHSLLDVSPFGRPSDLLALKQTWWGWGYWINDALGSHHKAQWRWVDETDSAHPILLDADFSVGKKPKNAAAHRSNLAYHRRPSIYLPKEAWGPYLKLTEVRVERLQDISEGDAKAEGCEPADFSRFGDREKAIIDWPLMGPARPYANSFSLLWDSINGKQRPGKPDISWKANPFVFALTFSPLS